MKILNINHSLSYGGAARAAYRIHQSVNSHANDEVSWLASQSAEPIDPSKVLHPTKLQRYQAIMRSKFSEKLIKKICGFDEVLSGNFFNSSWPHLINNFDCDIVHLHWICAEMMSINDVGLIKRPILWTLHDLWPFSGIFHRELIDGKKFEGADLNFWARTLDKNVFNKKLKKYGQSNIIFVCPSQWIYKKLLMSGFDLINQPVVIPNPINIHEWRPLSKKNSCDLLGLDYQKKYIFFSAINYKNDKLKGFDLIIKALTHNNPLGAELVVVGGYKERFFVDGVTINCLGFLHDDLTLQLAISASDIVAVPSRSDNFPNTVLEALACGRGVVGFDVGGIPDMVHSGKSGLIVEAFDIVALSNAVAVCFENKDLFGKNARSFCVSNFSYEMIGAKYLNAYKEIIDGAS